MNKDLGHSQRLEKIVEAASWAVIVLVIFAVRFVPQKMLVDDQVFILIAGIIAFILLYYLVIYRYFSKTNRLYLKSIADIILIGVLIHLLKDYGHYFYALYFLPIAAAALSLEFMSALLVATVASLLVVLEVFLGSYEILPDQVYRGVWEIGLILVITIFCRLLAIQLRQEQKLKEQSLARQKVLEEEALREKEFLSLTSHQLYTPISIVRGFATMLNSEKMGKLQPKQKEAVIEIYNSAKRMAGLVKELLSISRIQSGTFELTINPSNINQLLENIVAQFNQTKENNSAKIKLTLPANLKLISIDEEKIRNVLYNLIDNSLKYAPKGTIEVSVKQNAEETVFAVKDNGVGIRQEDFEKMFQPFFRGKNILELDNKGTGLGLYIARLVVEKHNGKIWFETALGQGTCFYFSLPNKAQKGVT